MEDVNLHFTGDIHAVSAANNLLAAMLEASILHGNPQRIDPLRVGWRRAVDMNDRALRADLVGLGGRANGYPRETGFDITAASEVMAILAVVARPARPATPARRDHRRRTPTTGEPVTAEELGAAGAMTVLLKEALKPNLIQTLEGQPCLMHTGPFANIAHGNSSLVADLIALKLGDYVVTESGFGSDMGMEKFFDIVCRVGGLRPSAVVLVVTVRALKHHGGVEDGRAASSAAIEAGIANLRRHLGIVREFGMPCVVAVNRRPGDIDEELALVKRASRSTAARSPRRSTRASSAAAPARARWPRRSSRPASSRTSSSFIYRDEDSIDAKIDAVATRVYGAGDVDCCRPPRSARIGEFEAAGLGDAADLHGQDAALAVGRPGLIGAPESFTLPGSRHSRLHRRRLARAAVRRDPADAGPRREAGGAERRHRRRAGERSAFSEPGAGGSSRPSARRCPLTHRRLDAGARQLRLCSSVSRLLTLLRYVIRNSLRIV